MLLHQKYAVRLSNEKNILKLIPLLYVKSRSTLRAIKSLQFPLTGGFCCVRSFATTCLSSSANRANLVYVCVCVGKHASFPVCSPLTRVTQNLKLSHVCFFSQVSLYPLAGTRLEGGWESRDEGWPTHLTSQAASQPSSHLPPHINQKQASLRAEVKNSSTS